MFTNENIVIQFNLQSSLDFIISLQLLPKETLLNKLYPPEVKNNIIRIIIQYLRYSKYNGYP